MIGWICPVCGLHKNPNDTWRRKSTNLDGTISPGGCSPECIKKQLNG